MRERVERVGSIVWAADNRTLFYTVEDEEQKRQFRFYRHMLGAPHTEDVLVYEETDERFNIGAGRTRDRQVHRPGELASHTTSEERFLPADETRRRVAPDQRARRRTLSTTSNTATACSLFAPTTMDAIFDW